MYEPPKPIIWPAGLPKPTCERIGSAVLTAMNSPYLEALCQYQRKPGVSLVRYMYNLACQRIRGMSTVEVARLMGAKSHTPFTNNGDWVAAFCRSSAGTAAYNEIMKALLVEASSMHARDSQYARVARNALRNHAGSAVHTQGGSNA